MSDRNTTPDGIDGGDFVGDHRGHQKGLGLWKDCGGWPQIAGVLEDCWT